MHRWIGSVLLGIRLWHCSFMSLCSIKAFDIECSTNVYGRYVIQAFCDPIKCLECGRWTSSVTIVTDLKWHVKMLRTVFRNYYTNLRKQLMSVESDWKNGGLYLKLCDVFILSNLRLFLVSFLLQYQVRPITQTRYESHPWHFSSLPQGFPVIFSSTYAFSFLLPLIMLFPHHHLQHTSAVPP